MTFDFEGYQWRIHSIVTFDCLVLSFCGVGIFGGVTLEIGQRSRLLITGNRVMIWTLVESRPISQALAAEEGGVAGL